MSELLFECYHVPSVAYGVDGLFSLYANIPDFVDSLVVSCGYQTIHVLPVLGRSLDVQHCRRLNYGGAQVDSFMHRILQLKYPGHFSALTLTRAEVMLKLFIHSLKIHKLINIHKLILMMIGCLLAEGWWWRGREVGAGVGRHGNSVLGMTWNCLVCILSGLFLGICGGTWFGANV